LFITPSTSSIPHGRNSPLLPPSNFR
jgi:hypothetical protein